MLAVLQKLLTVAAGESNVLSQLMMWNVLRVKRTTKA